MTVEDKERREIGLQGISLNPIVFDVDRLEE
jgi:hypothetical protein